MYRIAFLIMLALALGGVAAAQEAEEPLQQRTMTVDGIDRTYLVYIPTTYTGDEALPVVVALHGRTGNGESMSGLTNLSALAEEDGFIAVYPDGLNGEWQYFAGILDAEALNTPDDVAFLRALPGDVAETFNVDLARVYLMGFSMGGFMTYRMACAEQPNPYAAFGIAAALFYPAMELPCLAAPVRPLVVEHGTADPNVRWDGIRHRPVAEIEVASRSVLESVSFFAGRNGCNVYGAERTDIPPSDEATSVIRFDFARCMSDQPVTFLAVVDGGHTWPGFPSRNPAAGAVNMDIDLTREFWIFFSANPLENLAESVP